MTTENYSIEPLPSHELVTSWHKEAADWSDPGLVHLHIASRAAQWGYAQRGAINEVELQKARDEARDEELEACCKEMKSIPSPLGIPFGEMASNALRNARRPKPKSQAEEALETLRSMQIEPVILDGINVNKEVMDKYDIIRAALERLRELEEGDE